MKQTIRKTIAAIIFIGTLSLAVIAQNAGTWTKILDRDVNDVAVVFTETILITKIDGTIWIKDPSQTNFIQIPSPGFAVRIAANSIGEIWVTTNDGRLFRRLGNGWFRIMRSNFINDVSIDENNRLWFSESTLTKTGVVFFTDDFGFIGFTSTNSQGFSRVSGGIGRFWGVGFNGTLWSFAGNQWTPTSAAGMGDVTVEPSGRVWLAGKQLINGQPNGTIWFSNNNGNTFTKDPVAQGFQNIAVSSNNTLFGAGFNGTLWKRQ